MGLDMYLRETKYLGHYEYMLDSERTSRFGSQDEYNQAEVVHAAAGFVNPMGLPNSSVQLSATVAYWRKANAIHGWFVQNVQNDVDDCREYEVTLEDLEKLVTDCELALRDPDMADEVVPPTDGFFFGMNREEPKDEWYYQDLKETIEVLKPIIERTKTVKAETGEEWDPCYFEYQSSW